MLSADDGGISAAAAVDPVVVVAGDIHYWKKYTQQGTGSYSQPHCHYTPSRALLLYPYPYSHPSPSRAYYHSTGPAHASPYHPHPSPYSPYPSPSPHAQKQDSD